MSFFLSFGCYRQISLAKLDKMFLATRVKGLSMTIKPSGAKSAVESSNESVRFIVNLMKASIINILYHRLPLDDREVNTKWYNKSISYKAFKQGSKNSIVRKGQHCMAAIKDAIEKGYLKDFYLFFYNKQNGDVVENYKFSFNYFDEKQRVAVKSETVESTTEDFLITLNEMHTHTKLGSEYEFHVELSYFDDTPNEYEPPGCRPIDHKSTIEANMSKSGNSVQIVNLYTGFHRMKCKGRGAIFEIPTESSAASVAPTAVEIEESYNNKNCNDAQKKQDHIKDNSSPHFQFDNLPDNFFTEDLDPLFPINDVNKTATSNKINDTHLSVSYVDITSDEETETVCLCSFKINLLEKIDILECQACERKLHAPCQGYLDKSFVRGKFECIYCRLNKDDGNDDETVVPVRELESNNILIKFRFMIGCIYKYQKIPDEISEIYEIAIKSNARVLKENSSSSRFSVDPLFLNNAFKCKNKRLDLRLFKDIRMPRLSKIKKN